MLRPLKPDAFDYWKAQHLLSRAGFGGTPTQVRGLVNLGLEGAVEHLVEFAVVDGEPARAGRFDASIMGPVDRDERRNLRQARRNGDEAALAAFRRRRQDAQRADRRQMAEIRTWWLTRMIETPRPLEEKMTLFWHGHFATNYRAIEDSYHMFLQNRLFRASAAGNFKGLAHGVIRDPAMLRYLNNDRNLKQQPNENLARELMELFTLGEGHGYTEDDIKEGARALTGYTFRDDAFVGLESRQYQQRHDDGLKRILGRTGAWNGDDFVEIIFSRRACSEFVCWKLYRYFVNDRPGEPGSQQQQVIVELARRLRESRYQLRPMLKTLFMSEHFYDASNVGSLVKSPVQLIVQAVRTLGTPARRPADLANAAGHMGQDLFYPPSVKGWSGGRTWINTSTLFVRQNALIYLLTGRKARGGRREDGRVYDAMPLVEHLREPGGGIDVRDAVTYLLRINLAGEPHPKRIESLVEFAESRGGGLDNAMLIALLSLITALPEYQLC